MPIVCPLVKELYYYHVVLDILGKAPPRSSEFKAVSEKLHLQVTTWQAVCKIARVNGKRGSK